MNRTVCTWACLVVLAATSGHAQTPPNPAPGAQAPGRGRGGGSPVKSPELTADGKVTFRLRAPNATTVAVRIAGKTLPMAKDDQGVWSATSDVLAPDYYTYSFNVDGASMNDPGNRQVQTSFGSFQSMLVVPGPQPWLPHAGVARGAITRHTFHSRVANDDREFYVYTPAGYDAHRPQPYPILYLLHGLGDDAERWMTGGGGANTILDNLIADGKAVPMVMVTTLGYGVSNGPAGAMAPENLTGYTRILLDEVMPAVDKAYNVTRRREQRAMAGLSMGGAETLYTGLNHLDKFAWLGSFSGAFVMWPRPEAATSTPEESFVRNFPGLDAKANAQLKMLWIVCGTADGLIGINRQFKTWLQSKNLRFTEQEVPDMGHVWPLWRQNLTDLAQKLFQDAKK